MSENVLPYVHINYRMPQKGSGQCCLKKYAKKQDYQEIPVLMGCSSPA
jgi:hypothetical protein